MELLLERVLKSKNAILGNLYRISTDGIKSFICYTLENAWEDNEVGLSCIPAGKYDLKLRKEGRYYERYRKKFHGEDFDGVIEVCDVPSRKFILIHIGNFHQDTRGCILVGSEYSRLGEVDDNDYFIGKSTTTYVNKVLHIVNNMNQGIKYKLEVKNEI